ncbi:MAG: endonuclease/exonuclease/phosphatase family protein [Chloroflexota bacterium]
MCEEQGIQFTLMTYNVGGLKDHESRLSDMLELIKKVNPDVLAVQEITEREEWDGNNVHLPEIFARTLNYGNHYCLGETISLRKHFHPSKCLFVDGIFKDWKDWRQGNALFSRWQFVSLGKASVPASPWNIPLYLPLRYEGNRDTDPRYVILSRLGCAPFFPYVAVTHFTTLRGERGGKTHEVPGKSIEAQHVRENQSHHLLKLIKPYILDRGELLFLLGDLNALIEEPCISNILQSEGGIIPLIPENPIATHPKVIAPVDHIMVFPGNRRVEYYCMVLDDKISCCASDHRPVVAQLSIYHSDTEKFKKLGAGVFPKY